MKRYLVVALVLTVCNAFGQSQQVNDLCLRKFQWMVHLQLDSLDKILDDDIRFVHSNGWIQNRSEVIADLKSGKLNFQSIEARDLQVRIYDKTAIVIGKGKFVGRNNNVPFAIDLLFTEVYVLKPGGWMFASRHANKLL